jgi:hypothetical protein
MTSADFLCRSLTGRDFSGNLDLEQTIKAQSQGFLFGNVGFICVFIYKCEFWRGLVLFELGGA